MKESLEPLRSMPGQLAILQAEARALGMFSDDRALVSCLRCGLAEDLTFTSMLITCRPPAFGVDTGFRFEETADGRFRCPTCGGIVTETFEQPDDKIKMAQRKFRK